MNWDLASLRATNPCLRSNSTKSNNEKIQVGSSERRNKNHPRYIPTRQASAPSVERRVASTSISVVLSVARAAFNASSRRRQSRKASSRRLPISATCVVRKRIPSQDAPTAGATLPGHGSTPEATAPLEALRVKRGGKDDEERESPEQDDRRHPSDGTYLRRCGDDGCDTSPDAARFPLSIADEGAKATLPMNPPPKFFHFRHECYCGIR
jgi:hypothetical protein